MISLIALAALASAQPAPAALAATLRARDQALLDAIVPGDVALWDRALTPDAVYVDENGTILDRARFLAELKPLSAGASGSLRITDYRVSLNGDTALVVHHDDEHEDYHGVPLQAGYLTTETWLRRGGEWKLALVHVYAEAKDPPAVALPAAVLDAYVGRYRAGKDLSYVIRRDGDHLVGGREGSALHPILAEITDVLFTPGQPRVKLLFQRDATGRVTGFINRREGEDIVWTMVR